MQTKPERDQEIKSFMTDIMDNDKSFQRRLIAVLARMTPGEWDLLERKLTEVFEAAETQPSE